TAQRRMRLLVKFRSHNLPYSAKELSRGGWPEPIADIYATKGGTPHLDRRHTVFGQLLDEQSYQVLDKIAQVETGAMDRPVEDVFIANLHSSSTSIVSIT
ncbi:peptidylprolyl isomerase, partial [Streptococcus gordonii]|uniref:peptidylprolyl isomerase n=1 Tax=Streptococcus gordonii TaxID=1302 RepID=UPI0023AED4B8